MRKLLKTLSIMCCMVLCIAIFSACDSTTDNDTESLLPIPSEIKVEGYEKEITVGDELISTLIVDQKINGEWKAVAKADFTFECDYDGTKYGEYAVKVYLNEYPHVKFEDVVVVKPLTVQVPSFTKVYDGELVDIKSEIEANSNGIYEVSTYTLVSKVGNYSASVTLTNPDKYVWVDGETQFKGSTRTINWDITKAPAQRYTGVTNLSVYYGDTLYEIAESNNLQNITWVLDVSTKITSVGSAIAKYNESVGNYEDTTITFFFDEVITDSNYTIEYYFFDGDEYVKDDAKTETIIKNIGELVNANTPDFTGFTLNNQLSNISGKVLKQGGLVLRLYYDAI